MLVLAGLGNPGDRYAGNRHNVGFMALDRIADKYGFGPFTQKFNGEISDGKIGTERVLLFKPMTFMNCSGEPLGELMRFYKLSVEDLYVFHDELDLPPGKLRVKKGGGAGGHNGLKSIDSHLSPDYFRVRIGIGHPGDKDLVSGYVLRDFSKEEWPLIDKQLGAIAEIVPELLKGQDTAFMTRVSEKMKA